jgi:hypothetical protein
MARELFGTGFWHSKLNADAASFVFDTQDMAVIYAVIVGAAAGGVRAVEFLNLQRRDT